MAVTVAASPTLGFQSSREEVTLDELPVSGTLPDWLVGSLLRTGPALFEVGAQSMRHWFDGLAMLHRFTIDGGRVSYGSRFLHGRSWRAAEREGRIVYGEFATDPCRSLFARAQSLFSGPKLGDNGNVNVAALGERFVAMTETPLPVQFDARTLEAVGAEPPYVAPGVLSTAHPHADRRDGAMINYAAALGPRSRYRFYRVDPATAATSVLAELPVRAPAYMHSFGLTERYFVLAEFPLVVFPLRLALSGRPFIENYRWRPELGTRFTLVDRGSGVVTGRWRAEPCFAFHHINSFERDGEVVVDVCAYPDGSIIEDLYLDRLRSGSVPLQGGTPTRFVLRPGASETERQTLGECGLELPRINYRRCNERPYRQVWGNDVGPSGWLEKIVALDVDSGIVREWASAGCYPGEPVFVARPGAEQEDDGVLLSVVLDAAHERSMLLALDAATLQELARAEVPHHIPFGFHGQFARSPRQ